jgi:hypothetical protein
MLQVYRLYVGLLQTNCSKIIDRDQVINTVARCTDSFTVYDAQGFFRGEPEDTLVITIAHESNHYIKSLAYDLCVLLHQDGIGLEYDGHYQRITQDCTIQARPAYGPVSNLDKEARRGLS